MTNFESGDSGGERERLASSMADPSHHIGDLDIQQDQTVNDQTNQTTNDRRNQTTGDEMNQTLGDKRNQTAGDETNQTAIGPRNQAAGNQHNQTPNDQRNQTPSGQLVQAAGYQRHHVSANQRQMPLCVVCKERPQYSKGGTTYSTCGLSCAQKLSPDSGSQTTCCFCANPCYFDRSKQYPTCGTECAAAAAKLKRNDIPVRMCNYCRQQPKYHDGVTIFPHCSFKCRDNARQEIAYQKAKLSKPSAPSKTNTACLMCWNAAKAPDSDLCNKCTTVAEKTSGFLLEAPRGHTTFHEVATQFKNAWNRTQCPDVVEVYKIVEPQSFMARHLAYRDKVNGKTGGYRRLTKSKANEYRQWHGTSRQCKNFDPGHLDVCSSRECLLCTTIREAFDFDFFASGICTSSTSSEADMECDNLEGRKTMLLVNVSVGKEIALTPDENPQIGIKDYDAARIIGRMPGGRPVNKLISYDKDAVQPLYIVVYS